MRLGWLLFFCLSVFTTEAATISSTGAGGDWNLGTSWVGGVAPIATDDVIIVNGSTINVTTNQTCVNLTLNGSGILNFPTNSRAITVNGTMTMNGTSSVQGNHNTRVLALLGDLNVPAGANVTVGGVNVAQAGTGTFNCAGAFTPTDNTGLKVFGNLNMYDGSIIDATVTEGITVASNMSVLPGIAGQHSRIGRLRLTVLGTTTVTGYFEFASSAVGSKSFNNTITVAAGGTWDNVIGEDPVINCDIVNNGVWPQPTGGTGRYDVLVAGTYNYTGTREIGMTTLRVRSASTVTNKGALLLTETNNSALALSNGGIFINGDGLTPAILTFTGYNDVVNITGGGSFVDFSSALNTVIYGAPINGQTVYPTTYYNMICNGDNTVTVNGTTTVTNRLAIAGTTTVDVTGGNDLVGTGSLVMTGTSVLRLSTAGVVPALTGASNALAAGTTIEFTRGGPQTAASSASFPYQNVLVSGNAGSVVTLNNVSNIAGDLTFINGGGFLNAANTPPLITVAGDFSYGSTASSILNTNLTAKSVSISGSGAFTYSNHTITLDQDNAFWAVSGTPVITATGTGQVVFTTGANQEIAGTTNPSFNRLVINNANDVTLNVTQATVTGVLTLTAGRLITGTNTLVVTTAASVSRTTGFVEGNLNKGFGLGTTNRTYEVGTNTSYTPVVVSATSVSTAGSMTVSSTEDDHPDINSALIEPSNTVNRYWSITNISVVFSAFSTGQVGVTFNWLNTDEDAALDNTAIIKWYNNSTLTWTGTDQFDDVAEQNPPLTVAMSTAANQASFATMNPTQLPVSQKLDFQVGEKIDPTFVYNRLTGANNWNNLATWIQQRTGVVTLTNGSGTITGSSTLFQAELVTGDKIMLLTNPAVVYTITSIDPTLQSMVVTPVSGVSTSGGYGRQYIPGINSPTSDVDAVVIGNTNLADLATTITLDISAQILTLDVGSVARATAQVLTHQNSTRSLVVLANATLPQPNAGVTNAWNINDATADVRGDVTIGTGTSNTVSRISRINITTGTLNVSNLKFKPNNSAGREVQTVLSISGAGTVNIDGALNFAGNRGTLTAVAASTFNFVRSASSQSIAQPTGSAAAWIYGNIHSNNTSAAGANFAFTSTAANVLGSVRVQTGLMTMAGINLVGGAGNTFQVADGATFEMQSASGAGNGGFPSGFGTITLGATSTVKYNQTGNTNPWPIRNTPYGHLVIGENGSTRNFELANATTTVAGNLTIGDGTSTPTLQATGAATLTVSGNVLINASASFDASNITNLNVGGDWTDDGAFTTGTNTTFNSPAANVLQTVGGTSSDTFNNLTINTSAATDAVRLTNDITVTNNLVLTQGALELNQNTLIVNNSATTAISRTTGFIKSENVAFPYGTIRWYINNTTGAHVYPFGVSSTQYIPFTLNVTVAGNKGVGTGFVPVSTYATAAANPPSEYPVLVNNLNGTTGGASVTDRYWNIKLGSAEFATIRPTSTVTFTALNTEKPTTWTAIGEPPTNVNQLLTQRWNIAAYWDPAQTSPAQTYTNNSPAAGTFTVAVPSVTNYSTSWTITDSSAPLPVELVSFTAELRNGLVELKWTTESELDNDFFTVQRTTNGETFEEIAEADGAGTSAQTHRYTAYDQQPLPGTWYYRVRQTDFNGNYSFSKLVNVVVPESYYRTVYPNPGNGDQVSVSVPPGDMGKDAEVWISDQSGRDVYRSARFVVSTSEIKVGLNARLTSGMYILTLVLDNEVKRFKLVVR